MNLHRLGLIRSLPILASVALLGLSLSLALAVAGQDTKKEERLAKVRANLKSDDVSVRRAAIRSQIHSDISAMLLDEMMAALLDTDGEVRATAATAIGNLGLEAVPAVPQLIERLKSDKVKEARETSARALGRIGKAASAVRPSISPALVKTTTDDTDAITRTVAFGALAMMEVDPPAQIAGLQQFLHDDQALVRMKAAHALGMIGPPAKKTAPEIADVLKHESDGHRRGYIARALGNVGDKSQLPGLLAAYAKETDSTALGEMRAAITKLGGKVPDKAIATPQSHSG